MQKIASALVKAQKAFGPALKTSTNPHFRSRYADLSACVEAVIDALNNAGIALIQMTHEVEAGVCIETLFVHESGETLSAGKLHVPAIKQEAQAYGSALTYARRYSLMAACGIAPEDDDGNAASRRQAPAAAAAVDEKRLSLLIDQMGASKNSEELQRAYSEAYAAANGNEEWQGRIIAAKKDRQARAKRELAQGETK
jgi:ERF superfamily